MCPKFLFLLYFFLLNISDDGQLFNTEGTARTGLARFFVSKALIIGLYMPQAGRRQRRCPGGCHEEALRMARLRPVLHFEDLFIFTETRWVDQAKPSTRLTQRASMCLCQPTNNSLIQLA